MPDRGMQWTALDAVQKSEQAFSLGKISLVVPTIAAQSGHLHCCHWRGLFASQWRPGMVWNGTVCMGMIWVWCIVWHMVCGGYGMVQVILLGMIQGLAHVIVNGMVHGMVLCMVLCMVWYSYGKV